MTMQYFSKRALVLAVGLLTVSATSYASNFHIDIDTSALAANAANGPFSLDFQLNSGDTLGNNTAVISNFTYVGGGPSLGGGSTFGGVAAGSSIGSTLTITDSSAFNEYYQSFAAGSRIGFDVSLTQNVDTGPTPDAFTISILDGAAFNITPNGPGDTLVFANLATAGPLTVAQLNLASGIGSYAGIAASVPEPQSYAMLLAGLGMLGWLAQRGKQPNE